MSQPKISRYSSKALAAKRASGSDRTDWKRVLRMSGATVNKNAREDADNPPLSARALARATIVRRGRPKLANPKQQVTLRLSAQVLAHYRARGAGWQSRIDEDLRKLAGR